jgi:hypothetical protein
MTDTTTPDLATVAAAYRQAADLISTADELRDYTDDHMGDIYEAAEYLRRRADELHRAPVEPAVPAPADDDLRQQLADAQRRITTLEHVAKGNKRHVQQIVPELERAEAALDRVRALHHPVEYRGQTICAHCSAWGGNSTDNAPEPYPCDTLRALDTDRTQP